MQIKSQPKNRPPTVGMVSLGCVKNQVDAEHMLAQLAAEGFCLSADESACDALIVNTCGFIEDAKRESIETVLELAALKETGRLKVLVVTGCLAERYRDEVVKEMPEIDVLLGIGSNSELPGLLRRALEGGEKAVSFGPKDALSLEGERILANEPYYAYLKVAEGCNNRCSYCAIPLIRGEFRSRRMEDIVAEAGCLAARGVRELNVVAQDTTRYGEDLYGCYALPKLLTQLCRIDGIRWVRILYCYPDHVTDELLDVMACEEKIVKYMDIPLQHASGSILKAMNRSGDAQSLGALLDRIRARVPGIVLRTTFIIGFPGETEDDFEELLAFVQRHRFDRLGCFAYSREEGTPAADISAQVDDEDIRYRIALIMESQMQIVQVNGEILAENGVILTVLCEGFDEEKGLYYGRSYMDAPDIDTKVFFKAECPPVPGDFVEVRVTDAVDYDVIGEVIT